SGLPACRVDRALCDGTLRGERVGRHHRIPTAELVRWAAAQPESPARRRQVRSAERRRARRHVVRAMHELGLSPGSIVQRMDGSKPTIYKDLEALGLERAGAGRTSRRLPPEERAARRDRARELYGAGYSMAEIARRNECSPSQVRRDLDAV